MFAFADHCGRELGLASLMLVAGHACVEYDEEAQGEAWVAVRCETARFQARVLESSLALSGSNRGLVRTVAQILTLALLERGVVLDGSSQEQRLSPLDQSYLHITLRALKCEPDIKRSLERSNTSPSKNHPLSHSPQRRKTLDLNH